METTKEVIKNVAYRQFCDSTEKVIRSLRALVKTYGLDPDDFRTDVMHLALFKTVVEHKIANIPGE